MSTDLEEDLNGLRKWLHDMESRVLPLFLHANWTPEQIETKLCEHQVCAKYTYLLASCTHNYE